MEDIANVLSLLWGGGGGGDKPLWSVGNGGGGCKLCVRYRWVGDTVILDGV